MRGVTGGGEYLCWCFEGGDDRCIVGIGEVFTSAWAFSDLLVREPTLVCGARTWLEPNLELPSSIAFSVRALAYLQLGSSPFSRTPI